jgi:hypothetical protein
MGTSTAGRGTFVADSLNQSMPSESDKFPMESPEPSEQAPANALDPGGNDLAPATRGETSEPHKKRSTKEALMEELKEVTAIVSYLAVSLSFLETYKSLLLLQLGDNEFVHGYTVALVEAVALGKIVALAQNLPFMNALKDRPLIWSVLYKAVVMTVIVDLGGKLEDYFFPRSAKLLEQSGDPIVLMVIHQLISMTIFVVLFAYRGADEALGKGTLAKLFLQAPKSRSEPTEGR